MKLNEVLKLVENGEKIRIIDSYEKVLYKGIYNDAYFSDEKLRALNVINPDVNTFYQIFKSYFEIKLSGEFFVNNET